LVGLSALALRLVLSLLPALTLLPVLTLLLLVLLLVLALLLGLCRRLVLCRRLILALLRGLTLRLVLALLRGLTLRLVLALRLVLSLRLVLTLWVALAPPIVLRGRRRRRRGLRLGGLGLREDDRGLSFIVRLAKREIGGRVSRSNAGETRKNRTRRQQTPKLCHLISYGCGVELRPEDRSHAMNGR
jgi:hypothetical protein